MAFTRDTLDLPLREMMLEVSGHLTQPWAWFFRAIQERLSPLGIEKTATIANNQSSLADVTGLVFDLRQTSQAIVEYLIQRITLGGGATELVESGIFIVSYMPTSQNWELHSVSSGTPDVSGVTFAITASGQIQYTSSNVTGTTSISKMTYRARTLGGKNQLYSSMAGGR